MSNKMKLVAAPYIMLVFSSIFVSLTAFEIGFGEDDIKSKERDGFLSIPISIKNRVNSNVSINVVPMTLSQYVESGRSLPEGISLMDSDPAEEGLDFNSSTHVVKISSGMETVDINIQLFNDNISESEEIFFLILDMPEDISDVVTTTGGGVCLIRIQSSENNLAVMGFSTTELHASEGDGFVDFFIEVDREIEPEVFVQINRHPNEGVIELPHTRISISQLKTAVRFNVIDDSVAIGFGKIVRLSLHVEDKYKALYSIIRKKQYMTIYIDDNEVPIVGFETDNSTTSLELMEGHKMEVCVGLLDPKKPEDMKMNINIGVALTPDSPQGIVSFLEEDTLDSRNMRCCFNVTAEENSVIDEGAIITLNVTAEALWISTPILVDPGLLQIRITDNDGIPAQPTNVMVRYSGDLLHVTWESHTSPVQPIDVFIVQVLPTISVDERGDDSLTLSRSRRQIKVPPMKGNLYEVVTDKEEVKLEGLDLSLSYTVVVCAKNHLGETCSKAEKFTGIIPAKQEDPIPDALNVERTTGVVSPVMIIVIAVVISIILLGTCTTLFFVIFLCKYLSKRNQYYPSRQANKELKTGNIVATKYCSRRSPESSLSAEWTLVMPTSCSMPTISAAAHTPSSSSSSSESMNHSRVFGTPV